MPRPTASEILRQHVLLTHAQAFRIFVRRRLLGVTRLLQILFQHPQRRAQDVEEE